MGVKRPAPLRTSSSARYFCVTPMSRCCHGRGWPMRSSRSASSSASRPCAFSTCLRLRPVVCASISASPMRLSPRANTLCTTVSFKDSVISLMRFSFFRPSPKSLKRFLSVRTLHSGAHWYGVKGLGTKPFTEITSSPLLPTASIFSRTRLIIATVSSISSSVSPGRPII